jgi:dTDP-4-dehydrorhamnose reductase
MRILITGSNGLLGQKIVRQALKKGIIFLATSKGENRNPDCPGENYQSLDICKEDDIAFVFTDFQPTHVIHTAAITNVDACELNPEECELVNVIASRYLFEASQKINAHFQLLSTDFIFDGEKGNYKETDEPNPLSVYAKSKVDGEALLLNSDYKNHSIVRTIIVYGIGNNLSRNNIICWAKEALGKGQEMNIIDDQFRAPTWADDLAWACLRICELNKTGIYHISGPETLSIYSIVERVANFYKLSTDSLTKTDSSTLNQPAKRPPRTGFDLSKSRNELGYNPKTLEETLRLI